MSDIDIPILADVLYESKMSIAFTGAGISAESGIPTYRDKGGLWERYDPSKYASIQGFREDPAYYWSFFRDVRYPSIQVEPNPGHKVLAELEDMGKLQAVITQNIDGLHQKAGSKNVVELHGNTQRIYCLSCDKQYTADEAYVRLQESLPPLCDCGGLLRPDVVFFGERLPEEALDEAHRLSSECKAMLCVGSSLEVYPAADMPAVALNWGAKLLIINKEPTPYDGLAIVCIQGAAGEVLPEALRKVKDHGWK